MALTPEQKEAYKREKAERERYWQEREKERPQEIRNMVREAKIQQAQKHQIHCPSCGSSQITAGDKGFGLGKAAVGGLLLGPVGLLGGLVGSKKVVVTCLNCGYQWQPGK